MSPRPAAPHRRREVGPGTRCGRPGLSIPAGAGPGRLVASGQCATSGCRSGPTAGHVAATGLGSWILDRTGEHVVRDVRRHGASPLVLTPFYGADLDSLDPNWDVTRSTSPATDVFPDGFGSLSGSYGSSDFAAVSGPVAYPTCAAATAYVTTATVTLGGHLLRADQRPALRLPAGALRHQRRGLPRRHRVGPTVRHRRPVTGPSPR